MLTSAAHGGMVSPSKTGKNTGSRESAFWNRLIIAGTLGRVGASWAVVPLSPLHSAIPAADSTAYCSKGAKPMHHASATRFTLMLSILLIVFCLAIAPAQAQNLFVANQPG